MTTHNIPLPKTGRPRKRAVAKRAADDIRNKAFDSIGAAARAHYQAHFQYGNAKRGTIIEDSLKDLKRYIVEELESGPKSMHVYRVLSAHLKKQRQQPKAKEERRQQLIKLLQGEPIARLRQALKRLGLDE